MLQIKHLTAPQKMPIFNFQDLQTGRGGNDTQRPQRGEKIIMN